MMIEAKELIKLQESEDNIVVLEIRYPQVDDPKKIYDSGHISGAKLLTMDELNSEVQVHGGNNPYKSKSDFKSIVESKGISNDTTVVLYDDGELVGPSRGFIQLKNLGINDVRILAGGMFMYQAVGGVISQIPIDTEEFGSVEIGNEDFVPIVDMEYTKSKIDDENTIIIDARMNSQYLEGHIPGSINVFYGYVKSPHNNLKSVDELNKLFDKLDRDKEIIVYCNSGMTAGVLIIGLLKAGYRPKLYSGSFQDWVSYDENSIEK